MKSSASHYLLLATFALLLSACAGQPQPVEPDVPDAWQQLQQNISGGELATAEDQLTTLQGQAPQDLRLEPLQRQLAEAYLHRSQVVLQKGDVNAAATALGRARALMPTAPALTSGVNGAMAQARRAELEKAEAALREAEARNPPQVLQDPRTDTYLSLNLAQPKALRVQLDAVAADVVNYHCDVIIKVQQRGEYRRLQQLLKARVSALAPEFDLRVGRAYTPTEGTHMLLIPRP